MTGSTKTVKRDNERFCSECGEVVDRTAATCVHCDAQLTSMQARTPLTETGMEPNVAGALSYLLTFITGIIFLLVEKENEFVRFHAWQAVAFGGATVLVWIAFVIFQTIVAFIPIIGGFLGTLAGLALTVGFLIVWVLLMVKAYQGERFKLPVLGDYAENWSASSSQVK